MAKKPWEGIDANERAYNRVHNALVGIVLDGVAGVSGGAGSRAVPLEKADEYLARGRRTLVDFEAQTPPGGKRGRAYGWMHHHTERLRDLLARAEAARAGAAPRMSPDSPQFPVPTSGERHERGENPRVSAPLKKRIDRVLGRGRKVS